MDLSEIIETIQTWSNEKQIAFCENILLAIPLSIRGIWSDNSTSADDKIEAIKWLNEFTHRTQNSILEFNLSPENNVCKSFIENMSFYSSKNETTKEELIIIVNLGFKRTNSLPLKAFYDYSIEYLVFHQALNEVCHGAYALPDWEFATLMGVTKKEAIKILNSEKDIWKK